LDGFGLDPADLGSPRNGLLLAASIEEAFDTKHVCFVWDVLTTPPHLKFYVLDPDLLNHTIDDTTETTFRDLHGKPLHYPGFDDASAPLRCPFRRLLGVHAKASFQKAIRAHWIDQIAYEQFVDYVKLSEGSRHPGEELDDILDDTEDAV